MARWLLIGTAFTLVACGEQASEHRTAVARVAFPKGADVVATLEARKGDTQPRNDRSLAYEHTVSVELPKDLLSARINEVRGACDSRKEFACTLIGVSFREELEVPSGEVRVRVAPTAVKPLIDLAAHGGRIVASNTHAEDLAEPIADNERELALLSSHRDRLSQFMTRKDLKPEEVISLSKEISSVQTQIDSLTTHKANLQRRIDTELLTLEFAPPQGAYAAERTPIQDALRSFGFNLTQAVGEVIRFLAALLPWLVIILPGIVLLRLFWRWITRWLARRESPR
jgi:hypothetical protein